LGLFDGVRAVKRRQDMKLSFRAPSVTPDEPGWIPPNRCVRKMGKAVQNPDQSRTVATRERASLPADLPWSGGRFIG